MGYRRDLWEIAAANNGVVTVAQAEDAGVPAVEVRKLASRGALESFGQGVYVHRDVPGNSYTQFAVAVALAGRDAFLQRESVLDLLDLGQFNPIKIRVGTRRRVRRNLPAWIDLEYRREPASEEVATYKGISATTVRSALVDMKPRMPRDRWLALVKAAEQRGLIYEGEVAVADEVIT